MLGVERLPDWRVLIQRTDPSLHDTILTILPNCHDPGILESSITISPTPIGSTCSYHFVLYDIAGRYSAVNRSQKTAVTCCWRFHSSFKTFRPSIMLMLSKDFTTLDDPNKKWTGIKNFKFSSPVSTYVYGLEFTIISHSAKFAHKRSSAGTLFSLGGLKFYSIAAYLPSLAVQQFCYAKCHQPPQLAFSTVAVCSIVIEPIKWFWCMYLWWYAWIFRIYSSLIKHQLLCSYNPALHPSESFWIHKRWVYPQLTSLFERLSALHF